MSIEPQAKELEKLKLGALRSKYHEVFGTETKSNNRPYLIKKIAQAIKPRRDQDASAVGEQHSPESADEDTSAANNTARPQRSEKHERDPRLPPPGTVLEREYQGKVLRAKLLEGNDVSFKGKTYSSLSKAAFAATGTVWNGYLFWKLAKRTTKPGQ